LDLNINFDIEQTHALVQSIYSETYKEFYLTVERKELEHDVFLWLCEIAKTDEVRLSASYCDTVGLGSTNLFTVELVNLVLSDFGQYSTVKIESTQLGTILLDQLENHTYQKEIYVSIDSANYPTVEGELCVYDGAIKKASVLFSFDTEFDSEFAYSIVKTESRIEATINGSHVFVSGREPIFGGSMYANVSRDGDYMGVLDLLTSHNLNSSTFTFDYSPVYFGNYSFEFYLNDPYFPDPQLICNATFDFIEPIPDSFFTHSIVKTESRIEVIINGTHIFTSGEEPIFGGSMYANVSRDGDYMGVLDLLTSHNLNSSTFTFDYSPVYFGNYSFEFYLNDPYFPDPQLICNATFDYVDPIPDSFFTHSIVKTESRIEVIINGTHIFTFGEEPIYGGSMYVEVYRDSFYMGALDLLTVHNLNSSMFTFDYSPVYFGNYSFEFYLNDPYLSNPRLICSSTLDYEDPIPDSFFTYSIVKSEARIEVIINGTHIFTFGEEPIYDGSMYADIYRDSFYMGALNLLTSHNLNSSMFTFDYSPNDFGNYSFEFYLNDPYFPDPQLICNATFDYEDPNPEPDPVTEFTYTVIKTESKIQVNIIGYYALVSGNQPIVDGSMYAYIYLEGNYMNVDFLLTYHGSNSSMFTFDYSPIVFGNYSFDFYLNDPYLVDPQIICNATFEYINPIPDPDPVTDRISDSS